MRVGIGKDICMSFTVKPGGTSNNDFGGSARLMFVSL